MRIKSKFESLKNPKYIFPVVLLTILAISLGVNSVLTSGSYRKLPAAPVESEYLKDQSNAFCIKNEIMYIVTNNRGLLVYNISDPGDIRFIAENIGSISNLENIALDQGYAYTINRDSEVCIFDLNNVSNPTVVGTWKNETLIWEGFTSRFKAKIQIVDKVAYLTGIDGITLLNVSNPENPNYLSSFIDENGIPLELKVYGNIVYAGYENGNIGILNASVPGKLDFIKQETIRGSAPVEEIEKWNDYIFVGSYSAHIFDASSPDSLNFISGIYESGFKVNSIDFGENIVHIASESSKLASYNISNIENPKLIRRYYYDYTAEQLLAIDEYLFVQRGTNIEVIDQRGNPFFDTDEDGFTDGNDTLPYSFYFPTGFIVLLICYLILEGVFILYRKKNPGSLLLEQNRNAQRLLYVISGLMLFIHVILNFYQYKSVDNFHASNMILRDFMLTIIDVYLLAFLFMSFMGKYKIKNGKYLTLKGGKEKENEFQIKKVLRKLFISPILFVFSIFGLLIEYLSRNFQEKDKKEKDSDFNFLQSNKTQDTNLLRANKFAIAIVCFITFLIEIVVLDWVVIESRIAPLIPVYGLVVISFFAFYRVFDKVKQKRIVLRTQNTLDKMIKSYNDLMLTEVLELAKIIDLKGYENRSEEIHSLLNKKDKLLALARFTIDAQKSLEKKKELYEQEKFKESYDFAYKLYSQVKSQKIAIHKKLYAQIVDEFKQVEVDIKNKRRDSLDKLRKISKLVIKSKFKEALRALEKEKQDVLALGMHKTYKEIEEQAKKIRQISRFLDLYKISNRVSIQDVMNRLDMSKKQLMEKILEWQRFVPDLKFDGEYIIAKENELGDMVDFLDNQFSDWSEREITKEGKVENIEEDQSGIEFHKDNLLDTRTIAKSSNEIVINKSKNKETLTSSVELPLDNSSDFPTDLLGVSEDLATNNLDEDEIRFAKLTKILNMSQKVSLDDLSDLLALRRSDILYLLVNNLEQMTSILVDGDFLVVENKVELEKFLVALDNQFDEWQLSEKTKLGKVE